MNPTPPAMSEQPTKQVHTVYHDSDGSVYCYDKDGGDLPYPANWPETIGDVQTFCRARGINFRRG